MSFFVIAANKFKSATRFLLNSIKDLSASRSRYDYNALLGKRILSAEEKEPRANQDDIARDRDRDWLKQEEIPRPNGEERKLRFLVSDCFYTMERLAGRVNLHLNKDFVVTGISYH